MLSFTGDRVSEKKERPDMTASSTPTRNMPAGAVPCVSLGKCGESLGWHHAGSAASKRCASIGSAAAAGGAVGRMSRESAVGDSGRRGERNPLRKMDASEEELLEGMRQTALRYLPFYANMMYKAKFFAVDSPPEVDADGQMQYRDRAAITEDWRVLINFDWVRSEFEASYEKYGDQTRAYLDARNWTNYTDEDVRETSDMMTNLNMAKVLLHEMGHAMYDTWEHVRLNKLDHNIFNQAEDAVINNALRVLGSDPKKPLANDDINGEFLEAAIYGGSIKCDDPQHSWHYTDPKTGAYERRCDYGQTTAHYYQCLKDAQEAEQQKSPGGQENDSDEDRGGGSEQQGQSQGQMGGSQRERKETSGASKDDEDGDDSGSGSKKESVDQDPSSKDGSGGGSGDDDDAEGGKESGGDPSGKGGDEDDGQDHAGCGKDMAERYKDDPLGKDQISEGEKEATKSTTAAEMEKWAEGDPDRAKQAGYGEGSMARRWAAHRRQPDRIRWDSVLKRVVRKSVNSHKKRRDTYSKINRRSQGMGRSGTIRRGSTDGYMPSVSAAIDTSGSMTPDHLFAAYNSVHSVIKRTGASSIKAFAVDSAAKTKPVKIRKADDLAPLLKGGGGTNMCVGIENAAQNGDDVCIVFTDAEVPWGEMAKRPDHIKHMDVVVAVIADSDEQATHLADAVPDWMQTVKINKSLFDQEPQNSHDTFIG